LCWINLSQAEGRVRETQKSNSVTAEGTGNYEEEGHLAEENMKISGRHIQAKAEERRMKKLQRNENS
jgi:hypothetical protein